MDLVTIAHAQDAARESVGASPISDWLFVLAGLVLGILALYMIFKKFEVSSGQAIVLGVAVGVACLPYVANFEWTKDGFKFTTKVQGSQLATQLEVLTKQEAEIRENLKNIGEALKVATERVAALEQARVGSDDSSEAPPPMNRSGSKFNPAFFDDLITNNEAAIRLNEQRLNDIGVLQRQLETAR